MIENASDSHFGIHLVLRSTLWQTMSDAETITAARNLVEKRPLNAYSLWFAATYEKAQKEAQTKDMIVVAKKLGQYWKDKRGEEAEKGKDGEEAEQGQGKG